MKKREGRPSVGEVEGNGERRKGGKKKKEGWMTNYGKGEDSFPEQKGGESNHRGKGGRTEKRDLIAVTEEKGEIRGKEKGVLYGGGFSEGEKMRKQQGRKNAGVQGPPQFADKKKRGWGRENFFTGRSPTS